jgi:seryl-tRNA synthetase
MANWQRTLRLNPEWDQAQEHLITTQELARSVAAKIRAMRPFMGELENLTDEVVEIADELEGLAEDQSATQQDFNCVMQSLYDWGDQKLDENWNGKKVCFVDTMPTVEVA